MPPKANQDADDVLNFINSLPDSKSGTPRPKVDGKEEDNSEDFLEFLDELANHEQSKGSTNASTTKFEPKKKQDTKTDKVEEKEKVEEKDKEKEKKTKDDKEATSKDDENEEKETPNDSTEIVEDASDELEIDPIGSITNWWSNEGSSKVSSLWGSLTSNAQQLSEQTYQIASTTTNQLNQQRQKFLTEESLNNDQIVGITNKLNSVFSNISQQLKDGLISKDDELLNILLVYDLYNVNYLDKLCLTQFNYAMGQVEGGIKVSVNNFNHKDNTTDLKTNLNMFNGKIIDGEKLCFANLESAIKDYLKATNEVEQSEKKDELSQTDKDVNSISKSNIFISIQPITTKVLTDEDEAKEADGPVVIEASNPDSFFFTLILKDITNNITISTRSQPFPYKWSKWLNGDFNEFKEFEDIDPSEWVKEWIKEGIILSFGVLAQEYVIKRMGF